MPAIPIADIRNEFDESLGYIKNDITALCRQSETVNYTVTLLIACGSEVLARGKGCGTQPHDVFADLLPSHDWKVLAKPLYEALRNGLAHKFDTKHLLVDGESIQIYIGWSREQSVEIASKNGGTGLFIGPRTLGKLFCEQIDKFWQMLQTDVAARERFRLAYEREGTRSCSATEAAAWKRLVADAFK